ncbi:MAG: T9SS type A sorting domain-containing protein [Melioribacteraceae bacterium]|nr:T9SS type A sorting domain-containing protein [Melioribacteraceae bacterium]
MVNIKGNVYLFGGAGSVPQAMMKSGNNTNEYSVAGDLLNDLWCYKNQRWTKNEPQSQLPPERHSFALCVFGNLLYIFGGVGPNGVLDDIWSYNPDTNAWENKSWNSNQYNPPRRYGHSAVVIGNEIYLIGGKTSNGSLSSFIYKYNPATQEGTMISVPFQPSPGVIYGYAAWVIANKINIFGGFGGNDNPKYTNEGWILDLSTKTWTKQNYTGSTPLAASHTNIVVVGDTDKTVLIIGGENTSEQNSNVHLLKDNEFKKLPDAQITRSRGGAANLGNNQIILFGGLSGGQPVAKTEIITLPHPPLAPKLEKVFNDDTTRVIKIYWIDNSDNENGFRIYRNSNGSNPVVIGAEGANQTIYYDQSYSFGDIYTYTVTAFNDAGESEHSNPIKISLIPPAPTNLVCKQVSKNVELTWKNNSDNKTQFSVERKIGSEPFSNITNTNPNQTKYIDTNLEYGKEYTYRVRAFIRELFSGYCNEVKIELIGPPIAPFLNPVTFDDTSCIIILISWRDLSNNEKGFRIYRNAIGSNANIIGTVNANEQYYNDTSFKDGERYTYTVTAFNDFAESEHSNAEAINVYPPKPQNVSCICKKDGIEINWINKSNNNPRSSIERRENQSQYFELTRTEPNTNKYLDKNVTVGNEYSYRIRSFVGELFSKYSEEVTVRITDVSIEHLPTEFNLSQNYPNPFNPVTVISYQLPVGVWTTLKIYDLLGNEITTLVNEYKQPGIYVETFHGTTLPSGVYFYRLTANNFSSVRKMIFLK